jgi:hypothetical protein
MYEAHHERRRVTDEEKREEAIRALLHAFVQARAKKKIAAPPSNPLDDDLL